MIEVYALPAGSRPPCRLTGMIEGLQWSNVNPGGHEQCSFTLPRQWYTGAPEIAQGNQIRIYDGLTELWRGRIDTNDRDVGDTERIGIVALGVGVALKDKTFSEVYVDSDLKHWEPMSAQRRYNIIAANYGVADATVGADDTTGQPALIATVPPGPWGAAAIPLVEAYYDASSTINIGSIYFAWTRGSNVNAAATWTWDILTSSDDILTTTESSGNLKAAGPGTGTFTPATPRRFGVMQFYYSTTDANQGTNFTILWTRMAVYGTHGLTKQGSESATTNKGFFASDIITNIAGRASNITARNITATTYVITQCEYRDPVTHEDAITDVNKYHNYDWGTWGPNDILDTSTNGYFDWTAPDTTTSHWTARRSQCDNINLSTELASLYNQVDVRYTDPAGGPQIATRTTTVAALDDAGLTRKARLDAGTLTTAAAQQLGDIFLALSGQQTPARGTITISQPIRHYQRGVLAPHFMRADGSNIRLPDVLTSRDALALDAAADRQALFPIKRVTVDCSAGAPRVSIEVDQGTDRLSALQARLDAAAQAVL